MIMTSTNMPKEKYFRTAYLTRCDTRALCASDNRFGIKKKEDLRQVKRLNLQRSLLLCIGRIMGSGDIKIPMRFLFWLTQAEVMGIEPVCGSSRFINSLP